MTPASGFGTVDADRSGLPLRVVPALSVGAEDGSAMRAAGPSDAAAGSKLRPAPGHPMTPASGFGAVDAGRSGLLVRVVPALSVGAEDRSAMRAASAEQDGTVGSSYGPGRTAP